MCLDRIHLEKPEPKGRGWKIFRNVRSNVTGNLVPRDYWPAVIERCDPYREGVWYEAYEKTLSNEKSQLDISYQEYVSGFHIFLNRYDAEISVSILGAWDDVIREVEYDGAHTLGDGQDSFPGRQVIAKRMRILPEGERTNSHAESAHGRLQRDRDRGLAGESQGCWRVPGMGRCQD